MALFCDRIIIVLTRMEIIGLSEMSFRVIDPKDPSRSIRFECYSTVNSSLHVITTVEDGGPTTSTLIYLQPPDKLHMIAGL